MWGPCVQIGSHFLIQSDDATGLVDVNAFLAALSEDEALLYQAMEAEEQQQQQVAEDEDDDQEPVSIDTTYDE